MTSRALGAGVRRNGLPGRLGCGLVDGVASGQLHDCRRRDSRCLHRWCRRNRVPVSRAAGEIVITARFNALPLSIDVTPDEAPEVQFSVEIAALPEVIFSQSGGTVNSADQVTLSVNLSEPYPGDVVGFLELRFETRVIADDPAIRWVTGGRQAPFQIAAGETQAVFLGSTTENTFQTGTVAGEIQMTAQFYSVRDIDAISNISQAISAATDITPDAAPGLRFSVMEAAPVLQRIALGNTSSGRFTMQITGHVTTRSVDSMAFTLAGRPERSCARRTCKPTYRRASRHISQETSRMPSAASSQRPWSS